MSDTPRTDVASCRAGKFIVRTEVVDADFARQLERELNKAPENKRPTPTAEKVGRQFRAVEESSFKHRFDGLGNPMK